MPFISECENDPSTGDLLFLSLCHLITAAKPVFHGLTYSLRNVAIAEGSNMPLPGEFILAVRDGAEIQPILDMRS